MKPFRRRSARQASPHQDPDPALASSPAAPLPAEDTYVTDGASLFRVAHAIRDASRGKMLLELEDCRTLDVILCPADEIVAFALETVVPSARR